MKLPSIEEVHEHVASVGRRRARAVRREHTAASPIESFASMLKPITRLQLSRDDARKFKDAGDLVVALAMLGYSANLRTCKGALERKPSKNTKVRTYENAKTREHAITLKKTDDDDDDDDEIDDTPDDVSEPIDIDDDDDDDDDDEKEKAAMKNLTLKELQEAAERAAMLGSRRKVTADQVLRDFEAAMAGMSSNGTLTYDVTTGKYLR